MMTIIIVVVTIIMIINTKNLDDNSIKSKNKSKRITTKIMLIEIKIM